MLSKDVIVTVHDPQPDSPQLNLVPVNPKSPLRKYSSNVWDCDGLGNETRFPETCFKSNEQIQNRPNYLDRYFWILARPYKNQTLHYIFKDIITI